MKKSVNKYLVLAIGIALIFHGSGIFYTLEQSYDALIHLFFSEHYASNWFSPWSYKWYTGFTVMSYPPLVHQCLALLSFIAGFKFALYTFSFGIIILFVSGVYRFSLLLTRNSNYAGFSALFSVFSSVFIETLHLFGQLPTLTGIALLMHSLPEIYNWIRTHKIKYLISSLLLMGIMVCSHHVTPIFGMIFFVFPVLGLAILDNCKEELGAYSEIRFNYFVLTLFKSIKQIIIFGFGALFLMIFCILPYWINTKNNPITQVPIPHGSRDNFLEVLSSGFVFFIIPYGITLILLPYIFYRIFNKRLLFFGLSFSMLFLLGTGGTTPIPKLILGDNAFSILTLDRFTFWAAIMSFPFIGEFFYRLAKTDYKDYLVLKFGVKYHNFCCLLIGSIVVFFSVFTLNIGTFRPSQPQALKMLPIVNFLNQDMHYKWRYLTLGFGDQMAWLATQTQALSVDGNYHSARRLPELTTKAVERLENSKYRGVEGIGSLQQFLGNPEKFNLKYIFSNDKFYDPILYFSGWKKLSSLENNVIVWEKQNVKPLASIIPKIDVPKYQKIIWSVVPISILIITIIWFLFSFFSAGEKQNIYLVPTSLKFSKPLMIWNSLLLACLLFGVYKFYIKNTSQISPENVVKAYYNAMDFKEFEKAYSYLNKGSEKKIDQFMLEISVTDGLLSSYAKLDEITTEVIHQSKDTIIIKANTTWITSLEIIKKEDEMVTIYKNNKWFIVPKVVDSYIPSNQFFNTTTTEFYNQGRRKITTQQTHHDDILPQPVLYFQEAKLIIKDSTYFVIGTIQNIDYFPAAISLKAILYDNENNELASFSTKLDSKHKLNPMEQTPFKIEFEEVAWINSEKSKESFNPKEFHIKSFTTTPSYFVLHATSTVATKNLYQAVQLNGINSNNKLIKGMLFNSGNQEVTVPQLLVSHYKNKELIWVDHQFLKESIRPHRNLNFTYGLNDISNINVILNSTQKCYVNGMENNEASYDRIQHFSTDKLNNDLITVNTNEQLKIDFNNFIGNE
jgi:hypothetical protein